MVSSPPHFSAICAIASWKKRFMRVSTLHVLTLRPQSPDLHVLNDPYSRGDQEYTTTQALQSSRAKLEVSLCYPECCSSTVSYALLLFRRVSSSIRSRKVWDSTLVLTKICLNVFTLHRCSALSLQPEGSSKGATQNQKFRRRCDTGGPTRSCVDLLSDENGVGGTARTSESSRLRWTYKRCILMSS